MYKKMTNSIFNDCETSLKVLKIIPYFLKDNLHYYLRAKHFDTYKDMFLKKLYGNLKIFFNKYGMYVVVDRLKQVHIYFCYIVKYVKPLKYKTKNKYIKGYNKN